MPLQIPYKKQPVIKTIPVGNEEAGVIEIERLYDLTPPESDYVDAQFDSNNIKSEFEEITQVAENIIAKQSNSYNQGDIDDLVAQASNLSPGNEGSINEINEMAKYIKAKQKPLDAAEIVSKIMANDMTTISANLSEISAWRDRQDEKAPIRNRILATAMLKFRVFKPTPAVPAVNTEWELEDTNKALADGDLNYKMIEALAEFAEKERNHWQDADNTEIDQAELKKRLSELEAVDEKKLTGTTSSGD